MSKLGLDALQPVTTDLLTDEEWREVEAARARGVSWAQIHTHVGRFPTSGSMIGAYTQWRHRRPQRRPEDLRAELSTYCRSLGYIPQAQQVRRERSELVQALSKFSLTLKPELDRIAEETGLVRQPSARLLAYRSELASAKRERQTAGLEDLLTLSRELGYVPSTGYLWGHHPRLAYAVQSLGAERGFALAPFLRELAREHGIPLVRRNIISRTPDQTRRELREYCLSLGHIPASRSFGERGTRANEIRLAMTRAGLKLGAELDAVAAETGLERRSNRGPALAPDRVKADLLAYCQTLGHVPTSFDLQQHNAGLANRVATCGLKVARELYVIARMTGLEERRKKARPPATEARFRLRDLCESLGYVPTTTTLQREHKSLSTRLYNAGISVADALAAVAKETRLPVRGLRGDEMRRRWTVDRDKMAAISQRTITAAQGARRGYRYTAEESAAHSKALRGRTLGGRAARGTDHFLAQAFAITSPTGATYTGRNLMHFVREHPGLFDDDDAKRIYRNLVRLRPGIKNTRGSWHGWAWDDAAHRRYADEIAESEGGRDA